MASKAEKRKAKKLKPNPQPVVDQPPAGEPGVDPEEVIMNEDICPICLNIFNGNIYGRSIKTPCNHKFHLVCAYRYWVEHFDSSAPNKCPCCREPQCAMRVLGSEVVQCLTKWGDVRKVIVDWHNEAVELKANVTYKVRKDKKEKMYNFVCYLVENNKLIKTESTFLETPNINAFGLVDSEIIKLRDQENIDISIATTVSFDATTVAKGLTDDKAKAFYELTVEDLERPNNVIDIALKVHDLFSSTIQVQYHRYGRRIKMLTFITNDDQYVFRGVTNFKKIKDHCLKVKPGVTFESATTGNPHVGGVGGAEFDNEYY